MEVYQSIIKPNALFQGIDAKDLRLMLGCLSATTKPFKKDEVILLAGSPVAFIGLVLTGTVRVVKEDANGYAAIISELAASEVFGEVFACAGVARSPVTVLATEDAEVLFLNYKKIITSCASACAFHARLIENMLVLLAKKTLLLSWKNELLSKRTTREKLLAFFNAQRGMAKKFTIPFNREELAQYLCVDRSAMSGELGRMRDEGLIKFKKNNFEML